MKTEWGRNWYQSIHFDNLSCWQVSFSGPRWTPSREEHASFLAGQTVYKNGSIDTSFDPSLRH
jgi:hypothetical protein